MRSKLICSSSEKKNLNHIKYTEVQRINPWNEFVWHTFGGFAIKLLINAYMIFGQNVPTHKRYALLSPPPHTHTKRIWFYFQCIKFCFGNPNILSFNIVKKFAPIRHHIFLCLFYMYVLLWINKNKMLEYLYIRI